MQMQWRLWLWAVVLGAVAAPGAGANDTAVSGVSGSARPLRGEHRDIQMVRELVWIEVRGDSYTTTADFEFFNHGSAQSVRMGFPEESYGGGSGDRLLKKSSFQSFATWVDGRQVRARRVASEQDVSERFKALWVKTVFFGSGQRRRVRVRTESRVGGMAAYLSEGGGRLASYNFSGGNWKGSVQESVLVAVLHGKGVSVKNVYAEGDPKPTSSRRSGRGLQRMRYRWANWPAEGQWFVTYTRGPSHPARLAPRPDPRTPAKPSPSPRLRAPSSPAP